MSDGQGHHDERMLELFAAAALRDLDPGEASEVRAELGDGAADVESMEEAAALVGVGLLAREPGVTEMPAHLREKLRASARETRGGGVGPSVSEAEVKVGGGGGDAAVAGRIEWTPWLVAAAALVLAAVAWLTPGGETAAPASQRLAALVERSPGDLVRAPWQVLEDPSVSGGETGGEVVWSDEAQEGYMILRGVEPNDPSLNQYQLWIFDAQRPDATPVDGGVFDVTDAGEVIVPIDPKIRVNEAKMFAVTVERPGGVVVSSRERLPLLAQVDEGTGTG